MKPLLADYMLNTEEQKERFGAFFVLFSCIYQKKAVPLRR